MREYNTPHNLSAAELQQLDELLARIHFSFPTVWTEPAGPDDYNFAAARVQMASTTLACWVRKQEVGQ